jgi:four helix bundle protein
MTLRIYDTSLAMVRDVARVLVELDTRDPDLAKQLRRAAASVVLNLAEGSGSTKGTRRARFVTARGSACEVRACLDVAAAFGYVAELEDESRDRLDHVIAALFRLARR